MRGDVCEFVQLHSHNPFRLLALTYLWLGRSVVTRREDSLLEARGAVVAVGVGVGQEEGQGDQQEGETKDEHLELEVVVMVAEGRCECR